MLQSAFVSILVTFIVSPAVEAREIKATVKMEPGVKIADDDLFVIWSQTCAQTTAPGGKLELHQSETGYKPRAMVAQKGQTLTVRNNDKIRHNSFAHKAVPFDSGLQKPGSSYDVKLTAAGVEKIFCRIHPQMVGEILVLNNPCFKEVSGENVIGTIVVPAAEGKTKIWLWSPRLRAFLSRDVGKDGAGNADFVLKKSDFLTVAPIVPKVEHGGNDYQ